MSQANEHASLDTDSAPTTNLRGTTIGDFRLDALIGRGAIGAVYRAEQISLKRPVAVKLLQSWTASRDSRRRFIEESTTLARLRHPGIAQVIAAGTRELSLSGPDKSLAAGLFNDLHSVPWIAMELVDGARTIVDHCRDAGLGPMAILGLFADVCDAVHHGHQQGVIHRDLKPANILVNARGQAKVIDFGIAKAIGSSVQRDLSLTAQGSFLGTLRYMSPEQCDGRGRGVDTRSDVYALGVVLYEALTGTLPYELDESSYASAARAVCGEPPKDPRAFAEAVPADAVLVLLKALRKDPRERYQSAAELADDLRRIIACEPVLAHTPSVPYKIAMFARRRPGTAGLIVAATLGLIAGIFGISLGLARENAARREADRIAMLANLTAADSSLRLGDGGAAMRRLKAVPEARRGWEWRYLHALADTSVSMWQITDKGDGAFLSHTGRYAYCCSTREPDLHADIVDTTSRQVLARIEEGMPSGTVVWNHDESLIALSKGQAVVLLDARTGAEIRRWKQSAPVFPLGAEFSPDGSLLAVGLSDFAGVVVYDVRSGKTVFTKPSEAWVYHPTFSPDGKELAWSDVRTVESVETTTWTPRRSVATARITSVEPGNLAYSPDGKLLAVVCGLVAQVIDVESWTVQATLRGHAQRMHWLSFDESGTRIVTTSIDRTVRVWNASTGEQITTLLGHEAPTLHARFIAGASERQPIVISVDVANRVRTWNLDANGPRSSARTSDRTVFFGQLDFSPESRTLRAVGQGTVVSFDLREWGEEPSTTVLPSDWLNVVPRTECVIRKLGPQSIVLESLSDKSRRWTLDDEPVYPFTVSPDGSLVGVIREGWTVSIHRVSDGVELGRTLPDPVNLQRIVFSPDSTTLATFTDGGVLRLWDAATGAFKEEIADKGDRSVGLCWSNDGTLLAYAHAREGVTVLDMRTRKPMTIIESVGGYVWSIAISPDQSRMAVGSQDRITHIYELPSGDELLQLRDHTGTVMSVAWSPDGRFLATGGYDKRVFVYDGQTPGHVP
ncbi:MAG: protein kinase [Phycisphaerales bacterium]|nr:protein kinase [Phycisphaerales bacterium]